MPKLWKKIQGKLIYGFNVQCEEWNLIQDLKNFEVNFSAREVTAPLDISEHGGGASIVEGGYEAVPYTTAPQELTFTWVNENHRFNKSKLSEYLDKRAGDSQLENQMKYQGKKLLQALVRRAGNQFYGYSTATVCETTTTATSASQTMTLNDAYGEADLDNAAFLASKWKVGDRVAVQSSIGVLRTNGIGEITAVTAATPSIAATMIGSCAVAAGDILTYANSMENTTIGGGTDYNKHVAGLLDGANTTSIHGLSGSTYPFWSAHVSSTGGRYSLSHLRAGQYAIQNNGGGKANLMIVSNGVLTDMTLQQQAVLRYEDAMNMEFDGATKVKGARIFTSRKVPNSRVFLLDSKKALKRWSLMPFPDQDGNFPEDAFNVNEDKVQDVSAVNFSLDLSWALVWQNRSCLSLSTGLTEA